MHWMRVAGVVVRRVAPTLCAFGLVTAAIAQNNLVDVLKKKYVITQTTLNRQQIANPGTVMDIQANGINAEPWDTLITFDNPVVDGSVQQRGGTSRFGMMAIGKLRSNNLLILKPGDKVYITKIEGVANGKGDVLKFSILSCDPLNIDGGAAQKYPVYPAPSLWLTDYIISQQLQAAYAAGVAAGASGAVASTTAPGRPHLVYASFVPAPNAAPGGVALTPAIKAEINDEIQAYLTAEATAAKTTGDEGTGGLDKLLADGKQHVFVASDALTVSPSSGNCGLTQGDVVQSTGVPAGSAETLDVTVLASKSGDCVANSTVPVQLADLQEMRNGMMASVDQGLAEIKAHPGQGGMPVPPAAALATQTDAPYAAAAPPSDPNVGQELQQADQQAQQTEQQVTAEATQPEGQGGAAPGTAATAPAAQNTPVTIALGQTTTDVALNRGRPKQIVNLGPKTIWVYDDMKIIFQGGKVSDVQ